MNYASIVFSSIDRLGNFLFGLSTVMIAADRLDVPLYLVAQIYNCDWFDVTGRKYARGILSLYQPGEEPPAPVWFRRDFDAMCSDVPLFQAQHRAVLVRSVAPLLYAGLADATPLPPDHLVVHVRSGDVMNDDCTNHHAYIQPPLVYYCAVIDRYDYRHVTIVTEPDQRNPVLAMLQAAYRDHPHVQLRIQSASVKEDAGLVLRATHLCVGTGTFGQALSLASTRLQRLYCFQTHVLFYAEADYDIRVLETVEPYPARSMSLAAFREVCAGAWTVRERDMTGFVETPLRFWDEGR